MEKMGEGWEETWGESETRARAVFSSATAASPDLSLGAGVAAVLSCTVIV
jgi:hypothetical protein